MLALSAAGAADSPPLEPQFLAKAGLFVLPLTAGTPLAQDLAFRGQKGIYVVAVAANSAGQRAKLQPGDIITRIVGADLKDPSRPGSLEVLRGGRALSLPFAAFKDDVAASPDLVRSVSPRASPIQIVVDPSGKGQFRTITAALAAAAPGDVVELRDGFYRESVFLPPGITLQGPDLGCAAIDSSVPIRVFGGDKMIVRRLTLRGTLGGIAATKPKDFTVQDCTIVVQQGNALSLQAGSGESRIENCRLSAGTVGVVVAGGQAMVADSVISNCQVGILAEKSARLEASGNTLDGNVFGLQSFDSQVTAKQNTISGRDFKAGVGLTVHDSQLTMLENSIRKYLVALDARYVEGKVTNNTFLQNGTGVWLRAGTLDIRGNTFLLHDKAAIALSRTTFGQEQPATAAPLAATIERNMVTGGLTCGIAIADNAKCQIQYNVIDSNARGLEINNSAATITNNTVVLNSVRGIDLMPGANATVFNNIVAFNTWGIVINVAAKWEGGFNDVFANFTQRQFPLESGDYVRVDRVPLSGGDTLRVFVYPADDLKPATDISVDPHFVRNGKDYRLSSYFPLAGREGRANAGIGALGVYVPRPGTGQQIAEAAQWDGKLVFLDAFPQDEIERDKWPPAKPWQDDEKEGIYRFFAFLREKAPGVLDRALLYRPIRLYRVDSLSNSNLLALAAASQAGNCIAFSDAAFRNAKDENRILLHEVVHLADVLDTISQSKAWNELIRPRQKRLIEALEAKNIDIVQASVQADLDPELYRAVELPSAYAAFKPAEGLAECLAHWVMGAYEPPLDIKTFLQAELLSPAKPQNPAIQSAFQGLAYSAAERWDDAVRAFSEAIRHDKDLAIAYESRGECYLEQEDFEKAREDFTHTIRINPTSHRAYFCRGLCLLEQKDQAAAIRDFTASLQYTETSRDFYSIYFYRARAHRELNEIEPAVADLTAAIRANPRPAEAFYARADLSLKQGQFQGALADLSKVRELRPDAPEPRLMRVQALLGLNALEEANAELDSMLNQNAGYAAGYGMRARLKMQRGDEEGALSDLNEALGFGSPQETAVWRGQLADILATSPDAARRSGRRAKTLATKACELTQWQNSDCLAALAAACAELGEFDAAVKWQAKALDLATPADKQAAEHRLRLFQSNQSYHRAVASTTK